MIRTWSATGLPPVEYYKALLARHLGGRELGNYVDLNILWRVMIRLQDDLFGRPSVNINNKKATDVERVVNVDDLASETCLLLRQGKKKYHLVRFQ